MDLDIKPIHDKTMRRFETIYYDVEYVEHYCVGGHHPVHLDDVFNNRDKVFPLETWGSTREQIDEQHKMMILETFGDESSTTGLF